MTGILHKISLIFLTLIFSCTGILLPGEEKAGNLEAFSLMAILAANQPGRNYQIAYSSLDISGKYRIWRVTESGVRTLVSLDPHDSDDVVPAISTDGTKIAYWSLVPPGFWYLFVINADGTGRTQITPTEGGSDEDISWSPDGTRIAFNTSAIDGGQDSIYTCRADGSDRRRLTVSTNDSFPQWSPDGARIVFASARSGNSDIWIMNANDGSNQIQLTSLANQETKPVFLSSGDRVLFHFSTGIRSEIHSIALDGSDRLNLTDIVSGSIFEYFPRSGKDNLVYFHSSRTGVYKIYRMRPDGSLMTKLTQGSTEDIMSMPTPDGRKLFFFRDGRPHVQSLIDFTITKLSDNTSNWGIWSTAPVN